MHKKKVILIILDGFAFGEKNAFNPFYQAKKPFFDYLLTKYPFSFLDASEDAVGLPKGQMGNSEVGHLAIGSGKKQLQSLEKINNLISSMEFFNLNFWQKITNNIHIIGLCSKGGVHSSIDHLYAILKSLPKGCKIILHIILDGRDVKFNDARNFLPKMINQIIQINSNIKIGTLSGRFYAMDRDSRFERTKEYYDVVLNKSSSNLKIDNIADILKINYDNNIFDEFIKPISFFDYEGLKDEDSIIFFNFRSDRIRQIYLGLCDENFKHFITKKIKFQNVICMTDYIEDKKLYTDLILNIEKISNPLSKILSDNNFKQIKIAETEKYPHVTYFFNGGNEFPFKNEDRILINSNKIHTHDLMPEMKAFEIKDVVISSMGKDYDLIVVNFANCDMIGHTGNFQASIEAIEALDHCLNSIYQENTKYNYEIIITSDHGNVEMMRFDTGEMHTQHTLSKVPFIYISKEKNIKLKNGSLLNVMPTILNLLKIKLEKDLSYNLITQV